MATSNSRLLARPARDEWGVYDPQVAGLAALFARLDAKDSRTAAPDAPATASTPEVVPAKPGFREGQ